MQFQYILCCGSTSLIFCLYVSFFHFNTSYVVVQHISFFLQSASVGDFNTSYVVVQPYQLAHTPKNSRFQYILCCGSTKTYVQILSEPGLFQYILCCGSTSIGGSVMRIINDFNTSYVVVQPLLVCDCYFLLY